MITNSKPIVDYIVDNLKDCCKADSRVKIVFAEGWNSQIKQVADDLSESIVEPLLILKTPDGSTCESKYKKFIISETDMTKYIDYLYELRKAKGMTKEEAAKLAVQPNYLASLLVKMGEAEGAICGIEYTTKDTLSPALKIVGGSKEFGLVSSVMLLESPNGSTKMFSDVSFIPNPTSEQLAKIVEIVYAFGYRTLNVKDFPTALLSYSTAGSGSGPDVDKVRKAYELTKLNPKTKDKTIYGEIQFDAAFVGKIKRKKAKDCPWDSQAVAYIFPSLESGNIGYKIAQWMGGYTAIGPIIIGMDKPVNDLSRGSTNEDIYATAMITAAQCYWRRCDKKW